MRLKTSKLCCAFAWSPAVLGTPPLLATASYSGAMDESFSNEAFLEIRLVDVKSTDETELPVVGRVRLPDRATRVDWSPFTGEQGIIGVACGNGCVYIFSAQAILAEGPDGGDEAPGGKPRGLLWVVEEHAGSAVRGFHFNPSKPHFFATGADDGNWQVWTLQDGATGGICAPSKISVIANVQGTGAVVHLQWHPKYAHIFATATAGGVVHVWNLKMATRVTALNVSKAAHGAQITAIAWNPAAATQLVVGLDDAHSVLQVWDLRTGVVPLREMAGHTAGITGLAWSEQEGSMVASCGGDGRTMWWDPNTGEKLGELQPVGQYIVDVQWCPAMPSVLATSSFDPLLCVSLAQDVSSAGGEKLGAVPKSLLRPCGACVNMSLTVASLAPGTQHDIVLSSLRHDSLNSLSNSDLQLIEQLRLYPAGSPERTQWLKDNHHELLAAFASAQNSRQPILDFLNAEADSAKAAAAAAAVGAHDEDDDPFAVMSQESQKSYEDRSAELVASGKIPEAVELCIEAQCFDDAFAVAFLSGADLIRTVHQRYVAHIAATNPKKRHVLFAGAIASGDFRDLIYAQVPWKEVLSAIVAFVTGDGFAESCNLLGDALRGEQDYEGAYHCYVCARNVDAVVDLWRLENRPSREVVRDTILLEETTQRAASGEYLAHCMCDYGMKLLSEGNQEAALQYLQRAARIGHHTAAVFVDRMRYLYQLPQDGAAAPYTAEPVSDAQSSACQAFLAAAGERRAREMHEQQQQQMQQQQRISPHPATMTPAHPQQQPPMPHQPTPPQQQQQQPQMLPRPVPSQDRHPSFAANASHASLPSGSARPPLMPGGANSSNSGYAPGRTSAPAPPLMPGAGAPMYNQTPPMQQQQQMHANPMGMMGGAPPPPPPAPTASAFPPPPPPPSGPSLAAPTSGMSALPPQLAASSPTSALGGQPKPRLMPHPVSAFSSMRPQGQTAASSPNQQPPLPPPVSAGVTAPPQPYARPGGYPPTSAGASRAGSQPGSPYSANAQVGLPAMQHGAPAPTAGGNMPPPPPSHGAPTGQAPAQSLASVNPAHFSAPLHTQIVQRLHQIVPLITDARRRAAVEQAAMELVTQLQQNRLPEDLLRMLQYFLNSAGTPNAAQVWAQMAERYGPAVQAFTNLRYL